jgi:hypothetical protein
LILCFLPFNDNRFEIFHTASIQTALKSVIF